MVQPNPYFFDGRLHFPTSILDVLLQYGFDVSLVRQVRGGVELDDTSTLRKLRRAVRAYVADAPSDDPIAQVLVSPNVQFMLSGCAPQANV